MQMPEYKLTTRGVKRTFAEQVIVIVRELAWTHHVVVVGPELLHLQPAQVIGTKNDWSVQKMYVCPEKGLREGVRTSKKVSQRKQAFLAAWRDCSCRMMKEEGTTYRSKAANLFNVLSPGRVGGRSLSLRFSADHVECVVIF